MVLHLGSLEYTHYVLNVQFYGLKEFHKRYFIREIVFYVSINYVNLVVVTESGSKDQKDLIFNLVTSFYSMCQYFYLKATGYLCVQVYYFGTLCLRNLT